MTESAAGKPRVDLDAFDLGAQYGLSRKRLSELLAGVEDAPAVAVPACPLWSVHDVLAHLVAVNEDVLAGRLTGPPSADETAAQVARRTGVPTAEVIEEWAEIAPALEKLLTEVRVWPGFLDVLAHEHDIRGAVGNSDGRDSDEMWAASEWLVSNWRPPVPLVVNVDGREHLLGGSDDTKGAEATSDVTASDVTASDVTANDVTEGAILILETTPFEAFRFRLGRRSREQLSRLAWSGDPGPVLDAMTIFGPEPYDVIE